MSSADGIPAMIEATIGVGAGGLPDGTPSAVAGTLEDVTAAFTDALKAPQRSVVRSAVDDVVAFIVNSDAITTATKPQLQALLRAVLSTLVAPSKTYHGGQIVRAYVAECLCTVILMFSLWGTDPHLTFPLQQCW
jgi:glycerol uptake facilitator-like aquaporin